MRGAFSAAEGQRGGAQPHFHRHLRSFGRADAGGGRQGHHRAPRVRQQGRCAGVHERLKLRPHHARRDRVAGVLRGRLYVRPLLARRGRARLRRRRMGCKQIQNLSA